ncbi:response regulator receiver domain [Acinetobacter courvalinii]|uniref:response regulator receiver domain n=1 Tax=Acinetobacter courvalinii TaxID=280147 RepID=UPI0021D3A0DE|nr:response regulator receiver domain [Acinetobacter courvalinii]MCU4638704.1 hypothetical protein [Acinetobacter courvalinii]
MSANIVYKDLIKEAFIAPIRSVMVIDDEYPTLTNLISVIKNQGQNKYKVENLERLQNIIKMCHGEMKWTVDVFDGKDSIQSHIPDRLKHSDLVILDYHLDGKVNPEDSEKARDILHSLDSNQHFNIVMVHTNGFQDDIEKVYDEILCDFIKVSKKHLFELNSDLDNIIEEWLVENDPDEERFLFLNHKFGIKDVVSLINAENEKEAYYPQKPTNLFHPFKADIQQLTNEIKVDHKNIDIKDITQWFGSKVVLKLVKELKGTREISEVKWGWENEVNFICTDNIFITVIRKQDGPVKAELYEQLFKSLVKFNPSPMFLLLAKIRHYIDEIGLEQANRITNNKYAQAGWLYNLLKKSVDVSEHEKAIDIHWEQLGRASKPHLRDFSKKLCESLMLENSNDEKVIVQKFFKVNNEQTHEVLSNLNAFSCSIPPCSTHLTTGSILKIDDKFWLCLSPSCDLVPGQRSRDWEARIGEQYTVFKAVQLNEEINVNKANDDANTNNYLFLQDANGVVKAYSIAIGKKNPTWDIFYAHNQGIFDESRQIKLTCLRKDTDNTTSLLSTREYVATVIAELRYAYALNFLQKLGGNQTRIGLNYSDKFLH